MTASGSLVLIYFFAIFASFFPSASSGQQLLRRVGLGSSISFLSVVSSCSGLDQKFFLFTRIRCTCRGPPAYQ